MSKTESKNKMSQLFKRNSDNLRRKSNDAILDAFTIEAQKIKIYRDFYPAKLTNEEGAGYDIPSSYLFAIAKYANYIVGKTFWDGNNFNTPQDLWAKWRQPGAILENAQSFMDKYFTNHLNKIPEALISYNYRFKYIWQTNTGSFDSNELPSFHGRGSRQTYKKTTISTVSSKMRLTTTPSH